jgi:sulfatase modifying factor 1
MKNRILVTALAAIFLAGMLSSCSSHKDKINRVGKSSSKTGMKFGKNDYFEPIKYKEKDPAPGLVLIPGGTFVMGGGEKDIEHSMDNRQRQVTVQSFYLDITEVANVEWKEFLNFVLKGQDEDFPETKYDELYPDSTVWLRDLAFNDPIAEEYFNHPAFYMYPVVGVDWHQANEYCKWRTKLVNNQLLEKDEDAVLYPSYRLPTEAEWEYAARGLLESEIYAWEGKSLRNRKGQFRANFKRGRGDYAGWRGGDGKHMTDGYMITAPVMEFYPNDFGLYNMSGNVAEWTQDTYRILALEDVNDFNPFRRKGKTEIRPDDWLDDVSYKQKESLIFHPTSNAAFVNNEPIDNVKVYRGGSWADIAYYLSPGSRRFFNADSSSARIGFRCAMIRVGSPD